MPFRDDEIAEHWAEATGQEISYWDDITLYGRRDHHGEYLHVKADPLSLQSHRANARRSMARCRGKWRVGVRLARGRYTWRCRREAARVATLNARQPALFVGGEFAPRVLSAPEVSRGRLVKRVVIRRPPREPSMLLPFKRGLR